MEPEVSLLLGGKQHAPSAHARAKDSEWPQAAPVLYAFDPRRTAILLIGGDKTGDERFHDVMIPKANDLYDVHLDELREEGWI